MGLLDRAMAAAEQAATKAKETAGELQTKRDLGQAYNELGRKAFELIEAGELSSPPLEPLAERIRMLNAELAGKEPGAAAPEPAEPTT